MRIKTSKFVILIVAGLILTALQTPSSSPASGQLVAVDSTNPAADYGHISGVPYQWQEINGFCHWAALSMALQHAGTPLDLHTLFAASGIGFSAAYLRYEQYALHLPGVMFKQMEPLPIIADLFGLNITLYLDNSEGFGALYAQAMDAWGIEYTNINGWSNSLNLLKATIDEGHPLVIWTDPYFLPAIDYNLARNLGLQSEDTGSGHAIVVIGYNDTSETVEILDPGVGSFGEYYGFPDDGRWFYQANYTSLDNAWSALGYGSIVIAPAGESNPDFTTNLISYILDRLRGDRTSYGTGFEDAFFWNFGADAFRGLGYDFTIDGLISYLDEFGSDILTRAGLLASLGFSLEATLDLQYLSFRKALTTLPLLLPELDLTDFVEAGEHCFSDFEVLSDNSSLIDPYYQGGATILSETLIDAAMDYVESEDITESLSQYEEELSEIADHLEAIANAWSAAATALETAASGNDEVPVLIAGGVVIVFVVAMVLVLFRRRVTA
ncbi:MAG: C39 family peptidase [Candidatus Hodarchaeota archaeon]